MSSQTPNRNLTKNDDGEAPWGGAVRGNWDILDLYMGAQVTTSVLGRYTRAALPAPGTTGQLAEVIDDVGGLFLQTSVQWFSLSGEIANAKDEPFDARGDGIVDDTAALQALFALGGRILIPPGVYLITGDLTVNGPAHIVLAPNCTILSTAGRIVINESNVTIEGHGDSSVFDFTAGDPALSLNRAIVGRGVLSPVGTTGFGITGDVDAGDTSFEADDAGEASSVADGDWVLVGERVLNEPPVGNRDWMRLEWKQVASVVGTTVNVKTPFANQYDTYDREWHKVSTVVEGVVVRNMKIITRDVVNDNIGVDFQFMRWVRCEDVTFDIAKGLAWQFNVCDNPIIVGNKVLRQPGRASSVASCPAAFIAYNTFYAHYSPITNGALKLEQGTCFSTIFANRILGSAGGVGAIHAQRCDYNDYRDNFIIGNSLNLGIYILGGRGSRTLGNRIFNVNEGVRFASDGSISPTLVADRNMSMFDMIRNATHGVRNVSGTNATVVMPDADSSVTNGPVTKAAGVVGVDGEVILWVDTNRSIVPNRLAFREGSASSDTDSPIQIDGLSATSTPAKNIYGTATVSGTDAFVDVAFSENEADALYRIWACPRSSTGSGHPDGAFIMQDAVNKATTGFRLRTRAAPGAGNTVVWDWFLIR